MGRFVIIIGLIHYILFIGSAPSLAHEFELSSYPLLGHQIFLDKGCVKCHSIYGIGGKIGRDLGKTLSHLGPTGIFAKMWNHSPEMSKLMGRRQKMPIFSEQEMADFIAFIYFLSYLDEPGDAQKGRLVLEQKLCLTCHQVSGKGGEIGPPLDKIRSYANPLSLAQRIWRYGIRMSFKMSDLGVKLPVFSGSELIDLFAYLKKISAYETNVFTYLRPGSPKVGERLFEEKDCFLCHKIGNKGEAIGPDLTLFDFHSGATQIAAKMWKHKMWKHRANILEKKKERGIRPPNFEKNEMADLVAYLYFLNFTEQSGDAEAGHRLFTRKGCVECHSIRGQGGNVGPDLALSDKTKNYISSTTAMWNHNQKMRILMEKVGISMPRFNEKEMKDLFFYLSTQRMKYEQ